MVVKKPKIKKKRNDKNEIHEEFYKVFQELKNKNIILIFFANIEMFLKN